VRAGAAVSVSRKELSDRIGSSLGVDEVRRAAKV